MRRAHGANLSRLHKLQKEEYRWKTNETDQLIHSKVTPQLMGRLAIFMPFTLL